MRQRRCRLLAFIAIGILTLAVGPVSAQPMRSVRETAQPRVRVSGSSQPAASSRRHFIGVMGAVVRAGVYQTITSETKLNDLVNHAGGLTTRATGTVRVVRNGRVAFQLHLPGSRNEVLNSGDVLIVEQGRAVKNGDSPDERSSVDIAIVNLIGRPILFRAPDEHRSVASMAALLGQSATAASACRVLVPGRRSRNSIGSAGRLENNSVMIFDPATVDVERIPRNPALPLPILLRRTVATRSVPSENPPILSPREIQEIKRRSVQQLLKSARRDLADGFLQDAHRTAIQAQEIQAVFDLMDDRPALVLAEINRAIRSRQPDSVIADSGTRAASSVPTNQGTATASANLPNTLTTGDGPSSPRFDGPTFAPEPTPAETEIANRRAKILASVPPTNYERSTSALSVPSLADIESDDAAAAKELLLDAPKTPGVARKQSRSDSVRLFVAVTAVAAILIVSWLLLSMGRSTTAPADSAVLSARDATTVLDRLIRNELPIREQPLSMPAVLEFTPETIVTPMFLPAPAPDPTKVFMIDRPHSVARPHFRPDAATTLEAQPPTPQQPQYAAETASTQPLPTQPVIAAPHFPLQSAPEQETAPAPAPQPIAPPRTVTTVHSHHTVPRPHPRTMTQITQSDTLGNALAAIRHTPAKQG